MQCSSSVSHVEAATLHDYRHTDTSATSQLKRHTTGSPAPTVGKKQMTTYSIAGARPIVGRFYHAASRSTRDSMPRIAQNCKPAELHYWVRKTVQLVRRADGKVEVTVKLSRKRTSISWCRKKDSSSIVMRWWLWGCMRLGMRYSRPGAWHMRTFVFGESIITGFLSDDTLGKVGGACGEISVLSGGVR